MENNEFIDRIQEQLRSGELVGNPHGCAEAVAQLSGEISFYLAQMAEIEKKRPTEWLELRNSGKYKSDTATDRAYKLTDAGKELDWYQTRCKRLKALLTGLKTLIRASELEANNLGR